MLGVPVAQCYVYHSHRCHMGPLDLAFCSLYQGWWCHSNPSRSYTGPHHHRMMLVFLEACSIMPSFSTLQLNVVVSKQINDKPY